MKLKIFFGLFFSALIFGSCLGVSADITVLSDGSGKIAIEYRVSQMLESAGRLDGNERWPAVPVGRGDFERGIAGIPDIRLVSYSAKESPGVTGGRDLVTKAELEFKNIAALAAFLDGAGAAAAFDGSNGNRLRLDLCDLSGGSRDAGGIKNADLLSLLREVCEGYNFNISLTAPKPAALTVIPAVVPGAQIVTGGKKVSFTIGMGDLLSLNNALALEIGW